MKVHVFSYRYAQEILEHPNNRDAWDEIMSVARSVPIFSHANKSKNNPRLSVVQQCMNTYFDRMLAVECGWHYHPLATKIVDSGLAADFRKSFNNITIQAEIQFGNMSRWYSDTFKLQAGYSQAVVDMGLCVIPTASLARKIDSNVVSYERVIRELPAAKSFLTLPILVLGLEEDSNTRYFDLTETALPIDKEGRKRLTHLNRYRVINAVLGGTQIASVSEASPTGKIPRGLTRPEDKEDQP